MDRLLALGLDGAALKQTRITAFKQDAGPLSQLGITADLIPAVNYPSVMIEEMARLSPDGGRVLVPVPEVRGVAEPFVIPEFISELERIGMSPHRVTVYRTEAVSDGNDWAREMLFSSAIDVTVLTSSAEIFSLLDQLGGSPETVNRTTVAFMGGYTAKTGRAQGFNVDVVPETFSMPGVVAAIEAHFRG